jgi:hypothetical protein
MAMASLSLSLINHFTIGSFGCLPYVSWVSMGMIAIANMYFLCGSPIF